jgi:hypothetical protein
MREFVVKREGTTSVVPLSPSFLSFRAGFSPRGICSFDFFSSLLSRAAMRSPTTALSPRGIGPEFKEPCSLTPDRRET